MTLCFDQPRYYEITIGLTFANDAGVADLFNLSADLAQHACELSDAAGNPAQVEHLNFRRRIGPPDTNPAGH